MAKETTQQALVRMRTLEQTMAAYQHALGVLELDAATAAPKGSYEYRGRTLGTLSQVTYDLLANPENGELLQTLEEDLTALDPQARREVRELRKAYDRLHRIPAEEYVAYHVLLNDSQAIWEKAKHDGDFAAFAPYLEKVVDYNRRFAGYYAPEMAPYDALLNEYEEGMTTATLDAFFAQLRRTIVPLLEKVRSARQIEDGFLHLRYPIESQRRLSGVLMDVLGLDRRYCAIAETEHPFTTNFSNKDVRITTHYYENAVASSMYSVIHEGGHAIYELGCDDCYNGTVLSGGVSMGIHESQSRFFENLIGRSYPFISYLFPKLRNIFPEQLAGVTAEMFYRAVNKAEPSLIRTEADELTYCLHIMVRYQLEKQLIAGNMSVGEIPGEWNRLYGEYLGIRVPDDRQGCLQDSHWAGGSFGYFPSYALGSAYGPQMLACMEKDLGSLWEEVGRGDLSRIKGWLGEHIHRYGCLYKPGELFRRACGEFDPRYYTDYLTAKFTRLYDL